MNSPSDKQITQSLADVFSQARGMDRKALWRAIFTVDPDWQAHTKPGECFVNEMPAYEWRELNEFIEQIDGFKQQVHHDPRSLARLQILTYCHIMESDFPLAVLRNLMLLLSGKKEDWVFHGLDKNGNSYVCKQPSQKVRELTRLASPLNLSIGHTVESLWNAALRHCFSHACYTLTDAFVMSTRNLSPTAREAPMTLSGDPLVAFEDLTALTHAARTFIRVFDEEYGETCDIFRRPNIYDTAFLVVLAESGIDIDQDLDSALYRLCAETVVFEVARLEGIQSPKTDPSVLDRLTTIMETFAHIRTEASHQDMNEVREHLKMLKIMRR